MKSVINDDPLNFVRNFNYPELKLQESVNKNLGDFPHLG